MYVCTYIMKIYVNKKKIVIDPKYFGCLYGQPVLKMWLSGAKYGCPGQPLISFPDHIYMYKVENTGRPKRHSLRIYLCFSSLWLFFQHILCMAGTINKLAFNTSMYYPSIYLRTCVKIKTIYIYMQGTK